MMDSNSSGSGLVDSNKSQEEFKEILQVDCGNKAVENRIKLQCDLV